MTKTKSMRTIIISLLMFAMIFCGFVGLGAIEASAADEPEAVWGTSADDLGGEGREGTLAEAVADAAVAGSNVKYIKMNKSVTITPENHFQIHSGDFTLDMGGYELSWGRYRLDILGGKVVFKNGTFTSTWNEAIRVNGDTESTEITFESGTYNNPSGTLVYIESAKQLTVKKDVTIQADIPLVIGSNCTAALVEGASLTGNIWDITCNSAVKITAGIYDIDCYSGSLDLTDHSNPTGIIILDAQGELFYDDPIINVENIKIPEEYGLFDQSGTLYTEGLCRGRLTVKKLHEHVWEYTASGTTITATCANTDGRCDKTDGCSVSIAVPDSVEYTGSAIEAKVTNDLPTDVTVTVVYTGEDLVEGKPVRNGTYTAKITLGEHDISVEYTIIHSEHDCDYPERTDTEHKETCGCGYEATVPHAFDEDTGICSCGGKLVNYLDVVIQKIASDLAKAEKDLADAIASGDTKLDGKITELTNAINAAKSDLNGSISTLEAKLDQKVADLQEQISSNDADIVGMIEDIGEINELIGLLEKADETLDGKITDAIDKAKEELDAVEASLEALIDSVKSDLDTTKTKLDKAIEDLNKSITDGDTELSGKITALNEALAEAKAALEKADTDNKAELVSKIEAADATLDAAIKAVQKNLDDAQAALNKAIADGDAALDEKITNLNAALESAKAALEKADADNKAALEKKIDDADATLDKAIKAVQKNLDDLKAALEAKDSELTAKDAALEAKDSELTAKDAELENKDSELQTFIIIVCVISGVALCGSGAFVVWFFIDRKKRI